MTAALALLPLVAHANLVTNGSFEDPGAASGTFVTLASLPGWTVGPNKVEVRNNVSGAAYAGNNYVELDVAANSFISQSIATTLGKHYLLEFAYSPRLNQSAATNPIDVFWNDLKIGSVTGDGAGNRGNVWSVYRYDLFGGAGATSTLKFAAAGTSDSLGGSLDAVSVNVPEPGVLSLLGIGLLGLGLKRRRSKAA